MGLCCLRALGKCIFKDELMGSGSRGLRFWGFDGLGFQGLGFTSYKRVWDFRVLGFGFMGREFKA